MQLARHSDPKLTMAVYGRAQLHDLGEAVRRLPHLMDGPHVEVMKATGTDGQSGEPGQTESVRFAPRFAQNSDSGCQGMRGDEDACNVANKNATRPKSLNMQGIGADFERMRSSEGSSPSRTRTYNKPVNSRLLYR